MSPLKPIWRLHANEVLGFEALARPSDGYGFSGPAEAFAVAEKLDRATSSTASVARRRSAAPVSSPTRALLFLNVLPQTLDHDGINGPGLVRAVRAAGLAPERVVLELTERSNARVDHVIDEPRGCVSSGSDWRWTTWARATPARRCCARCPSIS